MKETVLNYDLKLHTNCRDHEYGLRNLYDQGYKMQSLMKIKMKKGKKDEEPEIFQEAILYREWARRFTITERLQEAIHYFKKSMKSSGTDDLRTLLGLCKAHTNFTKYKSASNISERCMEIDPDYYRVIQMRTETLYKLGEFSYSLAYAHRGRRLRRMPFELDIYQANETIENCVGRNTSPNVMKRLQPWIKNLEKHRKMLIEKLQEEEDEFEGIDEDQSRYKVNDLAYQEQVYYENLHKFIAKIFLGSLADDKEFLKYMTENPETLETPNKESTDLLIYYAARSFRKSIYREDILRSSRPLYARIFFELDRPIGHKIMIENERKLKMCNIVILADFLLRSLHAARMRRDYLTFFRFVDRIKDKFDSYSEKMFPLKKKCLNALYKMIAWAYIDPRNLMCLESEAMKDIYLKHHLRIKLKKLPRDNDLAWVRISNKKEALKVFRRRLAMASEPLEIAWLFHDICKLLIEIQRYDLARYYAKKARSMAIDSKNEQWILNSTHLMILIELHQHNRSEAKEVTLLALASAKKLGIDYLVDFYTRTLRIVDEMDMEIIAGLDGIATRQQLILELMPEEMKSTVDFLFRSMDAVPAERRLSVMPGCKPIDRKFKLPCKRMTILPEKAKDIEKETRSSVLRRFAFSKKRPGYIDFESYD